MDGRGAPLRIGVQDFGLRSIYSAFVIVACIPWAVEGFTVDDELEALRRGPQEYAALHGMQLDPIVVETSDGWLLGVHRVRSMTIYNAELSPPVLLSPGIGCTSMDFMVNRRNESLAFILADHGYDVWIVNYRANKFSHRIRRNGKIERPIARDYFRGTWQYMAERDVPAVIDKMLAATGQDKIYLVGHSMGTTILTAFLSENHDYDDKVQTLMLIAPALIFGEDTALILRMLSAFVPGILRVLAHGPVFNAFFSIRLVATPNELFNIVLEYIQTEVCRLSPAFCAFLINITFQRSLLNALLNKDPHIRSERTPIIYAKYPGGSPMMDAYLYAQEMFRSPWVKMDYDEFPQMNISNEEEYNQPKPPPYNLTDIQVPFEIFVSVDDIITGPGSIRRLLRIFQPTAAHIIEDKQLTHQDTLWAWDARCYIYDNMVNTFDRFELQRGKAIVERPNNSGVNNATLLNRKRLEYRSKIVPNFVKGLGFKRTCPHERPSQAG